MSIATIPNHVALHEGEVWKLRFNVAPKWAIPRAIWPRDFLINRLKARLFDIDPRLEFRMWDEIGDTFEVTYRVHDPNPVPLAIVVAAIVSAGGVLALTVSFLGFERLVKSPAGARVAQTLATGAAVGAAATGAGAGLGIIALLAAGVYFLGRRL